VTLLIAGVVPDWLNIEKKSLGLKCDGSAIGNTGGGLFPVSDLLKHGSLSLAWLQPHTAVIGPEEFLRVTARAIGFTVRCTNSASQTSRRQLTEMMA
jgi:hypothetical protein